MYYVRNGSVPPQRHTQHRRPDGGLYAEELFGVEGFTGRSSLLYHLVPPTGHAQDRAGSARQDRGGRRAGPSPSPGEGLGPAGRAATSSAAGCPLFFNHDVVMGIVRPAGPMEPGRFYRNGVADEMLYVHEGTGVCDTIFGPLRYGPGDYLVLPIGTTWRLDPDAGSEQRMLWLECPSEIEPPKRYRNDYGQLLEHSPYSQRDLHAPEDVAAARRDRRVHRRRPFDGSRHRVPLPEPPVRSHRLGRLPLAVPVQHRGLPADHRPGPPAAAGPPDLPGAELRRLLVRPAQVRLPPARDPGAVQPLEHQQRRGHLLRGRQLHEPTGRGCRLVHARTRRASRTARIRARPRHRSGARRPKSWRSWSTRSTRSS